VLAHFHQFRLREIGLSSVAAVEFAYGVAKSGSERNRRALEMFLAPLEIAPFDEKAVWAYCELHADLERLGQPIGSLDTMIAAHALSLNVVLVTNNTREFCGSRVCGWKTGPSRGRKRCGRPACMVVVRCLLPSHPLSQPDLQRFRQFADQQCVAPGDPAVDGPGRVGLQGFVEQGLGGDVVVDQAEFVLQLG
jgi:tRNA(fMet)-specific endonuclease VapC